MCVVSGQPILVAGIRTLLGESADADICYLTVTDPAAADVVIYDVFNLATGNDQESEDELRKLAADHPGRVLALSRLLQPGLTARALSLGAAAPVSVSAAGEELTALVDAAANGDLASYPQLVRGYDAELARALEAAVELTPRQKTVISRIAAGYSNEEIASELFISINTLKSAIRNAYARIGVTNRAGAVAWAIAHGYQAPRTRTATTR